MRSIWSSSVSTTPCATLVQHYYYPHKKSIVCYSPTARQRYRLCNSLPHRRPSVTVFEKLSVPLCSMAPSPHTPSLSASSPAQATSGLCVCCQHEVGIAAKFSGCDVPRSVAREYHNPGAANSTPPLSSLSTRRNSNSLPAIGQRARDICDRGIGGHPVPGLELALPKSELLRPSMRSQLGQQGSPAGTK